MTLQSGIVAPPFQLPDGTGVSRSLEDVRGEGATVVAFVCNHCPYVVHLAGAVSAFAAEFAGRGVGFVAISSNDVENYPQDAPDKMVEFARESGWDFPYLYDADQAVAHAYYAACTPDFYVFDRDLKLTYCGQFDASRPKNTEPVTGADLRAAVEATLAEGQVPASRPSTGCNIKWKPGNEPAYFG